MKGSFLTLDDVKSLVKSKEHFYKAMLRNQWYLPKFKSSIITQDYMNQVRKGSIWCPKYSELRLIPCPDPPSKEILITKVINHSKTLNLQLGIQEGKEPDKGWLISVLAHLDKDDEIFQKGYTPPVQMRKKSEKVIDNSDNFYSSLPMLHKKRDLKSRSRLKEYQVSKEEEAIKQLKEQKAQIERRINQRAERMKQIEKRGNLVRIEHEELQKLKQKVMSLEKEAGKKQRGRTPLKGALTND